jgi:LPXTG-motif cell wall-anchored protein
MKRIAIALGALVALLLVPSTAYATEVVCPDWTLHSITGTEWGDAAEGSVIQGADEVDLVKPEGGGTEFVAKGLDLSGVVTVDYELSDDADFAAGAVRLFAYSSKTPDTLNDAPDAFVAATAKSGTLTLPTLEHVGTVGMVYDASNTAGGVVTFSNLKVGGQLLSFTDTCATASPSASPSAPPSASATAGPSSSSTPAAGNEETLPKTGFSATDAALLGGVVLLVGAVVFAAARSRRRFEA